MDAKGPIKWACNKIRGFFHTFCPYLAQNMQGGLLHWITWMILFSLLVINYYFVFHLPCVLVEPWQHAGLMCEGACVRSSLASSSFFTLNFFFHKNLGSFYTFTYFFNFQGGPQPLSQELSRWDFISKLLIIQSSFWYMSHLPATTCKILDFVK